MLSIIWMGSHMKLWNKKINLSRWIRIIHRDLGFLMVGISLVYAVSGITLNHIKDTDPAFETTEVELQIEKGLTAETLPEACRKANMPNIKRTMPMNEDHFQLLLEGGIGVYNVSTGELNYEVHRINELIFWINRMHYNRLNGWHPIADCFAIALIFFAISGLFMVKGKKGIAGSGKWLLLIGLLIPLLYVIFNG